MWQAKHEEWCQDQSRYCVLKQHSEEQDINGNCLDVQTKFDTIHAECKNCCAKADWVE